MYCLRTENPCVGGSIPPLATALQSIISVFNPYKSQLKQASYLSSTRFYKPYIGLLNCLQVLHQFYKIRPHHPYGVPPQYVILRATQSPQKNPAYINILNNLEKQYRCCYIQASPKTATIEPMRLILIILVFVSSIQLASTTASAGISTKRQDILKLIGTTYAPNDKFAWLG